MAKPKKSEFLKAAGKMWALMQLIVNAVLDLGGSDEDLQRLLNDNELVRHIAELIMAGRQKVRETYQGIVDYAMDLSKMIQLGKYDYVNDDIVKHFKLQGVGKVAFDYVLVTVPEILDWLIAQGQATDEQIAEKWVTTRQVIAYLASNGLLEALIEHLLALGIARPELQRQFPIIALGSFWVDGIGFRNYPYLDCVAGKRKLSLNWGDDDGHWSGTCRFLAVGK